MELLIDLWNNSVIFRLILILTPILILVILAFRYLFKSQEKIIIEYKRVKKLIEDAQTKEQLQDAWDQAINWSKLLWHQHHNVLSMEIKTMLEMKQQYLNK